MSFTKRFSLENVPDRLKMRLFDKKRHRHFYDFSIKYNDPISGINLDKEEYITIESDDLGLNPSDKNDLVIQRCTGVYDNVGNLLYEGDYVHLFGYGKYRIEYPYKELYEYEILTKATNINHLKKFAEVIKPLKWFDINMESLLSEATTDISEYSIECVSEDDHIISIQKYSRVTETNYALQFCSSLSQAKTVCWWDYVADMSEYLIEPQPPQTYKEIADKYISKVGWADVSLGIMGEEGLTWKI